jgi:hypothetical protein
MKYVFEKQEININRSHNKGTLYHKKKKIFENQNLIKHELSKIHKGNENMI